MVTVPIEQVARHTLAVSCTADNGGNARREWNYWKRAERKHSEHAISAANVRERCQPDELLHEFGSADASRARLLGSCGHGTASKSTVVKILSLRSGSATVVVAEHSAKAFTTQHTPISRTCLWPRPENLGEVVVPAMWTTRLARSITNSCRT